MTAKLNYDFLKCIRHMPPLTHSVAGEAFDIKKSKVANWISSKPDIIQKIFDMAINQGAIKYNSDSETWEGVDYDNN